MISPDILLTHAANTGGSQVLPEDDWVGDPKPKTRRDPKYLAFIRLQPCEVCGSVPSQACHTGGGGMALKGDDWGAMPLCHKHHREQHQRGARTFARIYNLNYGRITDRLKRVYGMEGV